MIGLAKYYNLYQVKSTPELIQKIDELKESSNFKKASGSASASKSRILKRFEVAEEIFGD